MNKWALRTQPPMPGCWPLSALWTANAAPPPPPGPPGVMPRAAWLPRAKPLPARSAKKNGCASGGAGGAAAAPIHKAGTIEVRNGPYGPYMFKTTLKTKKFVSVPSGLDVSKLNAGQLEALYKSQLAAKEAAATAPKIATGPDGYPTGTSTGKKFYKKKA